MTKGEAWTLDIIRRLLVTFIKYYLYKEDRMRRVALVQVLKDHDNGLLHKEVSG
jgi:hypothetical protein